MREGTGTWPVHALTAPLVRSAGRGLSANTLRAYRRDIAAVAEQFVDDDADDEDIPPAADRVRVDELTPDAVVDALARLQHGGLAPATRARIHGTLAALCAHLVRQGDLRVDPMAESGLERPKQARSLPRYIERDAEIAKVLRAAVEPDPNARNAWPERDIALAAVLAGTGIRASELCRLRIRDLVLDVEDPYIRVTGKGRAVCDCPLAPEVVTTLEQYLESREERTKRHAGRNAPVWLNSRGQPLTTSALDYHVRGWYDRAGVPHPEGAATHAFRHTVAMQLINRASR
jgi:integrase/recombinase XerC